MAINEDVRLELSEDTIVFDNPSFDNSITLRTFVDGECTTMHQKHLYEQYEIEVNNNAE